jgi:hypothetical protein
MFNPAGITLGDVSSTFRDFSVVGFLLVIAWKSRGIYESVNKFFKRTINHMDTMEIFAHKVVNNHLTHLEEDMRVLVGRKKETENKD